MYKFNRLLLSLAIALCSLQQANASSIQYDYSASVFLEIRGDQLATQDQAFFTNGSLVSGSLTYDNAAIGFPGAPGTIYLAVSNFIGSIGGNNFADGIGGILAINNAFDLDPTDPNDPLIDLLAIAAEGAGLASDLNGFSVENGGVTFALVNVRMFWFSPTGDFLADESLPIELAPFTEVARIAFDFQDINDANNTHTIFAEPLALTPVPVPAAAWLLLSALSLLGVTRKKV